MRGKEGGEESGRGGIRNDPFLRPTRWMTWGGQRGKVKVVTDEGTVVNDRCDGGDVWSDGGLWCGGGRLWLLQWRVWTACERRVSLIEPALLPFPPSSVPPPRGLTVSCQWCESVAVYADPQRNA